MSDPASLLLTPRPVPHSTSSHLPDSISPLTILTRMNVSGTLVSSASKRAGDVELPYAFPLSIATTRCSSTVTTASPRDCGSAYADLFSPPSAAGPLSPLELPASCHTMEAAKRTTSAVCRSLHFHDSWLTRVTAQLVEESTQPPASAVLPSPDNKRHSRRDKAKRRSRSAQRHPHSQQQQQADNSASATLTPAAHVTYSTPTAQTAAAGRWGQSYGSVEALSSDDEWEGGMLRGAAERGDVSGAFVFSDLY